MPDTRTDTGSPLPGFPCEPGLPPEVLDEPLDRLRAAADPDAIAAAVRDALDHLPGVLAGRNWADDCGFGDERRRWSALTGRDGAAETFRAARDHLVDALDGARDAAAGIRHDPDPAARRHGWCAAGPAMLRYVAGVSGYARGLLTHTTPQAVRGLLESIGRLAGTGDPADVPNAVYTLLCQANAVLVGPRDWEPALAGAARDWSALIHRDGPDPSAVRDRDRDLVRARDGIGRAASAFARAVQQWLQVAVDPARVAGLAGPLAAECSRAIRLIDPDA